MEQVDIERLVNKKLKKKQSQADELRTKQLNILNTAFSVADGEIGATYLDQEAEASTNLRILLFRMYSICIKILIDKHKKFSILANNEIYQT